MTSPKPKDEPDRHEPFVIGPAPADRPALTPAEESERVVETFLTAARDYAETESTERDAEPMLAAARTIVDRLRQREKETERLSRIAERVNYGVSLDETLAFVYEAMRDVIPYDRIGFSLINEQRQSVVARWAKSDRRMKLTGGYEAPLEDSTLKTILDTGRPRIINDLVDYLAKKPSSESTRLVVEEGMCSSLTCPLIVQGKPIGFMFFSSVETDAYSDAHVEFFLQIAGQLSAVVEKSRLYSELDARNAIIERQNEAMTRDLDLARQVQRALIPETAPDVAGLDIAFEYDPAIQVGGDLLDVIPVDGDRVLLFVADAMGHGVSAALVTSVVKAALDASVEASPAPTDVLAGINRALIRLLGFSFVTAACCLVDGERHAVEIALAGHQPPLHLSRRSGEVAHRGEGGLPLGVDRTATYVSAPVPLSPGDTLLLYTDGVVEAMNRSDKQYGTARLEAQFRTHGSKKTRELLTAIRADLEAHAEGRELGDDVTLLAVKTTG